MNQRTRAVYYREAARFWRKTAELQRARLSSGSDSVRADMEFYVVSVQRLRNAALRVRDRLRNESIRAALETFDSHAGWREVEKRVRNYQEHLLGPNDPNGPGGYWYFNDSIVETLPGGQVRYLLDLDEMDPRLDALLSAIEAACSTY